MGADPARELPLLGREMRRAVGRRKKRALAVGALDLSTQFPLLAQRLAPPERWAETLDLIREKIETGAKDDGSPEAKIAARLPSDGALVVLGQQAQRSAHWSEILSRARELTAACGARLGVLVESANAVGASIAAARRPGDKNVAQMLAPPTADGASEGGARAFVLLGCEAADFADPAAAAARFAAADLAISIHPFAQESRLIGNVLLPAAAPSETDGLFVSGEGRAQAFAAAVAPPGEARPGWKILRVLGGALGLDGFDFDSIEEVRAAAFPQGIDGDALAPFLRNDGPVVAAMDVAAGATESLFEENGVRREFSPLIDSAPHLADPVVRRAAALQKTARAKQSNFVFAAADDLARLSLAPGARVSLRADGAAGEVEAEIFPDPALSEGVLRLFATAQFAPLLAGGKIHLTAAAARRAA